MPTNTQALHRLAASLAAAPTDLLDAKREFDSIEDRNLYFNVFCSGTFGLSDSALDETLDRLQDGMLNCQGLRYFIATVIINSYKDRIFCSFSTGILIHSLARSDPSQDADVTKWGVCWNSLEPPEYLEVLAWLQWVLFDNLEWNGEREEYIEALGPILEAMQNVLSRLITGR